MLIIESIKDTLSKHKGTIAGAVGGAAGTVGGIKVGRHLADKKTNWYNDKHSGFEWNPVKSAAKLGNMIKDAPQAITNTANAAANFNNYGKFGAIGGAAVGAGAVGAGLMAKKYLDKKKRLAKQK